MAAEAASAAAAAALVMPTWRLTTFGEGVRRIIMTDTADDDGGGGGGETDDEDDGDRTRANTLPAPALGGVDGDKRLF